MVNELLDRGANIEEKDERGMNPLIEGIFLQLFNQFKWFIDFLFIASSFSRIEVVKVLLDRGASVKPVTYIDSQSALHKGIYILS